MINITLFNILYSLSHVRKNSYFYFNFKWFFVKSNLMYNQKLLTFKEYTKIKKKDLLFSIVNSLVKMISKFLLEVNIINNNFIFVLNRKEDLLTTLKYFATHYKFQCKELADVVVVDYIYRFKRFEISYNLLSLKYRFRFIIKLNISEQDIVNSSTLIFSSANWLEREVWDFYGIYFKNHPDLRRILTDYGFNGFPLRKDFPLSGYIEVQYDNDKQLVVYNKLELTQEFRFFEFSSPWGLLNTIN